MPKIRKSTSLKFAAVAIGVAGIVGLTISSASSLNLAGGTVAAASTTVAGCQPDPGTPITVTFGTTYTPAASGYTVTSVKLAAVDTACVGQNIKVTLQTGTAGSSLVELSGVATAGSNTLTVPAGTTIAATSVTGTSVVIYN